MEAGNRIPYYQVDAFTDTPYAGNPAAVCVLQGALPETAMQAIAREMNLSETAFVEPVDKDGTRRLRWFTPTTEVPLCGHATLATARALLEEGEEPIFRFTSASGPLEVRVCEDGGLTLDFPADVPSPAPAPAGLLTALGAPDDAPTHRAQRLWVVRLADADAVRSLRPSRELGRVEIGAGSLGVAVTAHGGGGVDFVSRFFAPWVGVDEDPVTGVAHTVLGPYWAEETGRNSFRARQLSSRGGELGVRVAGERVHLTGDAVIVASGELVAPRAGPPPLESARTGSAS